MGLLILTDWKKDSYDLIFVMVDWLTKSIHYKPIKITINILSLAKIIIFMIVKYYGLYNSIVTN